MTENQQIELEQNSLKAELEDIYTRLRHLDGPREERESLEERRAAIQSNIDYLNSERRKGELIDVALGMANETAGLYLEALTLRRELNDLIAEKAAQMADTVLAFRDKQASLKLSLQAIDPNAKPAFSIVSGTRTPDLSGAIQELKNRGATEDVIRRCTADHLVTKPLEFDEAINIAERIVTDARFQDFRAAANKAA